jgi:uncharacterized protein YbaR (Trm112 family)
MKRARAGSNLLLLTPDQLLARIATLVPLRRTHALRYQGVFAPNSRDRARVVPVGSVATGAAQGGHQEHAGQPAHSVLQTSLAQTPDSARRVACLSPPGDFSLAPVPEQPGGDRVGPRYRVPWAELLRKVFSLDVLACPQCGGQMELLTFIAEAGVAKKILDHLGLASTGPPLVRAEAPEEAAGPGPEYDRADPTYED